MPTLQQIVNVSITRQTKYPTLPGFGTPGFLAFHSKWVERLRRFAELTEMTDAGVAVTDPMYLWAQSVFSQNPRPEAVVIGRRASSFTQTITLTPQSAVEGDVYTLTVAHGATSTDITRTVPAASTLTAEGTAIAALIDAALGSDGDAASVSGVITIAMDAGVICRLSNLPPISKMLVAETTADPGIAADFAACLLEEEQNDANSFFTVDLDCAGKATIVALAAAVEATKKLLITYSSDSACATAATTDVMSTLKASGYDRSAVIFAQYANADYRSGAWVGKMLPSKPGEASWAHKTLASVHADTLTSGQADYITSKYGTTYQTLANTNITYQGQVASGDFIDNVAGTTELEQAMQLAVLAGFTLNPKVPYTDFGIQAVGSLLNGVLSARVADKAGSVKFLAADPAPLVILPRAKDVAPADKAARILRNVQFTATIAGAIHRAAIAGNLSV